MRQRIGQRVGQPRQVPIDQLTLQRDRRRRHDDRSVAVDGAENRRNQIRQRLAGAGAGLHDQVLAGFEGLRHGLGHLLLAAAFAAAERGHRDGQQLGHGHGYLWRGCSSSQAGICVVGIAGSPCAKLSPSHGRLRSRTPPADGPRSGRRYPSPRRPARRGPAGWSAPGTVRWCRALGPPDAPPLR